jgi:hypothetical protein
MQVTLHPALLATAVPAAVAVAAAQLSQLQGINMAQLSKLVRSDPRMLGRALNMVSSADSTWQLSSCCEPSRGVTPAADPCMSSLLRMLFQCGMPAWQDCRSMFRAQLARRSRCHRNAAIGVHTSSRPDLSHCMTHSYDGHRVFETVVPDVTATYCSQRDCTYASVRSMLTRLYLALHGAFSLLLLLLLLLLPVRPWRRCLPRARQLPPQANPLEPAAHSN